MIICSIFKKSPVFRIGGDEFVALLENNDYFKHKALIRKFEADMEQHILELTEGEQISVAFGVAIYDESKYKNFTDVFQRADMLMYENKALTKNSRGRS